jgi:intracellular multiplication protein IcmQ
MALHDNDPVFNKKLISILDNVIEKGHWEDTLFLQATGKKLREFRERLKSELNLSSEESRPSSSPHHRYIKEKKTNQTSLLVFILIYCAEGTNLRQWETVINSLATHSMTRPIYKNESDVQTVIRGKANKQNDAYVALSITENDISPPFSAKIPVDRYGNELVVLKEGVVHQNNIEYFMHTSGRYIFQNGKLVRLESTP